jgi:hypothetical protein
MGWAVVAVVVLLILSAPWFGADSRDGLDWKAMRWNEWQGVRSASRRSFSPKSGWKGDR